VERSEVFEREEALHALRGSFGEVDLANLGECLHPGYSSDAEGAPSSIPRLKTAYVFPLRERREAK
jgi:hypothetical protein